MQMTDKQIEKLWDELANIPFDFEEGGKDLTLAQNWFIFKKGTEREEIWRWFDKYHSKGIAWLLYEYIHPWDKIKLDKK